MSRVKIQRHIYKSISYRFVGTSQTILIGFFLTGDFKIASSLGIVELILKPLIYFFHERIWYKWIKIGIIEDENQNLNKNGKSN